MNLSDIASAEEPLRKSARHLRWFVDAFERQVKNTEAQTGNQFAVDKAKLAEVFAAWLKAFDAQKPRQDDDNLAYVGFAAGLMLQALIRHKPVSLVARASGADEGNPAYFWPEGYLYVAFCLTVRGLVLEMDFNLEQHPSEALDETRTWWSFKENVQEDPSLAIAFLDLFAGVEPEWTFPEVFRPGQTPKLIEQFYTKRAIVSND